MNIDVRNIVQGMGYDSLTAMQSAMCRAGQSAGGVVLLSPTGSGKTLAFLLPLASRIDETSDRLQAVVIVPTRELAQQSEAVLRQMKLPVRSLCLYGGRPTMEEHRTLRAVCPQVVFATPGRLCDHLDKGNLDVRSVDVLVMDEFDKCLELGFEQQMGYAVGHLKQAACLWLISATKAAAIPEFMHHTAAVRCATLDYLEQAEAGTEGRLQTFAVASPQKDKLATLEQLLLHLQGRAAIVFVAHRESVERVAQYLKGKRFAVQAYHGGMEQEDRERGLYKFRCGAANVLVSTDLAARGLDIPEVRAVIHYHLPLKAEEYTHRNGRTARWQAEGAVYLITGPEEALPDFAADAEPLQPAVGLHQTPVPAAYAPIYIGRGKRDKLSKADVLGFLCKKGGLQAAHIGRIDVGPHYAYAAVKRTQLKQLLSRIAGEKIKGMKTRIEEMRFQ